jgi:hypothetical protein
MYYLARKLGANFGIALLASAFFTFSPPRSAHLWAGHINLLLTATVPFIFLVLLSIRKQLLAHRRVSVALVICLLALGVATLLSDFIVCFLIAYTILFCVMVWAWRRYMIASKLWVRLLVMAAILIGADQAVQHLNRAGFSNGEAFFWGADLLQFLTPSTQSWLYGDSFLASLPPSDEHSLFLGFTVVALFLASVIVVATRRVELGKFDLLLLGVLLLSILVALPAVNVGGYRIVRSPLSLLHYIPLWNENRCPTRMSQLAWFIMPLFSLGVFSRLRWIQQLNLALQVLIVATVGILALGEYLPSPYKLYYLDNKAVYRAYLGNQTTSALVLPFGIKDGARTWGIWEPEAYIYQYNHNVRLMGGYISRIPDDVWHSQQTDSLVQQLVELQVQPASLTVDSATCIRWGASFLSKYPIQSVVIPPSWRQSAAVGFLYACLRTHIGHQEDRQGYAIWKLR